jgi:hypothetical protein
LIWSDNISGFAVCSKFLFSLWFREREVVLLRTVILLDRSIISLCDDVYLLEPGTVVLSSLCGVRLSFNEAVVARSLAQPEFFGDSSRARLCVRGRRESGSSRHDDVAQCEWSGSYTASALLHFVPYYQQSLDVSP